MSKQYTYVASLVVAAALGLASVAAAQTMSSTTDDASSTTDQMSQMSPVSGDATTTENQGIQFGSGQPQDTAVSSTPLVTPTAAYPAPMVTQIDESSHALIRGTVTQVAADSITVNSWGNSWTVRMAGGGTVIPAGIGGMSDLSGIHTGDFVGVEGTVILGQQSGMIESQLVRDWTTNPYVAPQSAPETVPATGDQSGTGSSTSSGNAPATNPTGDSGGTSAGSETTNPAPGTSY